MFKSPCIQLIKKGEPYAVSADACTGCKRCITSIGCPGIEFSAKAAGPKSGARGQAYIDADLCNGCGLCAQVCPFGAISRPVSEGSRSEVRHAPENEAISGPGAISLPTAKGGANA